MTCDDVARPDPDLGLVVALADGPGQRVAEAGLEARLERAVHALDVLRDGRADRRAPASGRGGP